MIQPFGRAVIKDRSVDRCNGIANTGNHVHTVTDHENGDPLFLSQPDKHFLKMTDTDLVNITGRFIKQKKLRLGVQSLSQQDSAKLPAGKPAHTAVNQMRTVCRT